MSIKKVPVKNATIRIPSGTIGHIGKFVPGILKAGDLPKSVLIYDPETKDEFEVTLVTVVPFTSMIPEALCYMSEGKHPNDCIQDIFRRCNTISVNQLAFYGYISNNSNSTLH